MSTPPPYRPPTGRHDAGEEPPPAYTEAQRRASLVSQPPEYEVAQAAHANGAGSRPRLDLPYAQERQNPAHPPTYTLPANLASSTTNPDTSTYRECRVNFDPSSSSAPLPNNSRKSTWQKLKEENEARKAKTKHVTHAQAAAMLGHDEEWERERQGWATSKERLAHIRRTNRQNIDFEALAQMLGVSEAWLRAQWESGEETERSEGGGREWHDDEWVKRRHIGYDDRTCVIM